MPVVNGHVGGRFVSRLVVNNDAVFTERKRINAVFGFDLLVVYEYAVQVFLSDRERLPGAVYSAVLDAVYNGRVLVYYYAVGAEIPNIHSAVNYHDVNDIFAVFVKHNRLFIRGVHRVFHVGNGHILR